MSVVSASRAAGGATRPSGDGGRWSVIGPPVVRGASPSIHCRRPVAVADLRRWPDAGAVTASSRRPRRRATSRGRRPACAGSRRGRRSRRRRGARRGPAPPRPRAADPGAARPRRPPSAWGAGWRPRTRPVPRHTAAARRAGSATAGSARSPSRCPWPSAPGRPGAPSTRRPASPPLLRAGRDRGRARRRRDVAVLDRLADRVAAGAFDTGEPPARLHGDLWSGNVLWTAHGAVLIDPAAHGGHREADLAMLALFGGPHLERVLAAYDEAAPLADGWRDRVAAAPGAPAAAARRAVRRVVRGAGACGPRGATSERSGAGRRLGRSRAAGASPRPDEAAAHHDRHGDGRARPAPPRACRRPRHR